MSIVCYVDKFYETFQERQENMNLYINTQTNSKTVLCSLTFANWVCYLLKCYGWPADVLIVDLWQTNILYR